MESGAFVRVLHSVLDHPTSPLSLHEPEFTAGEYDYLKRCLDSGWVSSAGPYVQELEARLAAYTGARHAICVASGTAALQVALVLAGVEANDEVLVPALTFVATANAVSHCGAVPHFVDSDEARIGLDPTALAAHLSRVGERSTGGLRNRLTGRRIRALVPMHVFGHPVDMAPLLDVAGRFALPVVEDAAESLGSLYQGRHTGTFGQLGCLSFNGNKVVTTGGGGAILTDDAALAARAKHLTTTAKVPHPWAFFHDAVAWNYRLPNLNAALGCAQMERLPDMLNRKRRLAERYARAFDGQDGLSFVAEPGDSRSNYWLNTIRLAKPSVAVRDALLQSALDARFACRPAWVLLHRLPMYASAPRAELPVAEALEASLINVPSSARLAA